MIPKIIHYCWFGRGEYPEKIKECIESWKKLDGEYELMLWNEDTYDISKYSFINEAYEAKKYAFVSDMVRFDVLLRYGGIYLDTDIEIVKKFDEILSKGVVLSGDESGNLDGGFMAGEQGHSFFKNMLSMYERMHFIKPDGSYNQVVINYWMQELLRKHGFTKVYRKIILEDGISIYPMEYFSAMDQYTGKVCKTDKTYCIHHHTYTWTSSKTNVIRFFRTRIIVPVIGTRNYEKISKRLHKFLKHKNYEG